MRAPVVVVVLLLGVGCEKPLPLRAPPPPPAPRVSADALFVRGAFAEAIAEYDRELQRDPHPRAVAQNQFLRAMARVASGNPDQKQRAKEELWQIEHEHAGSVWGMLARVYLGELSRGTVLRQAVQQAGAELHQAEERIAELEGELARVGDQNAELQLLLTNARDERAKLQRRLEDAQEKGAAHEARVRELEDELAALKRIDMQRQP